MTEASASQLGRACGVYGAFGYGVRAENLIHVMRPGDIR
jgi:hypothetical protein